jgi:putative oxidoreductase
MNSPVPSLHRDLSLPRLRGRLDRIPYSAVALLARAATVTVFLRAGLSKIGNWSSTLYLFENEYKVPLLPPDFAAHLATTLELGGSAFIALGLLTRVSALALSAMTLVIQLFVYPAVWPDHIQWLAFMLILIARGPGVLSLDHLISRHIRSA